MESYLACLAALTPWSFYNASMTICQENVKRAALLASLASHCSSPDNGNLRAAQLQQSLGHLPSAMEMRSNTTAAAS